MAKAAPKPTLLDSLTPEVVYRVFPEQALLEGRESVERGRVSRPDLRGARAEAVVVGGDRRSHRARLALTGDELISWCSCGRSWCQHAAALGLLLVGEARSDDAEEVPEAATPRQAERQRREARGASELFEIRRRPNSRPGILGEYQVASPSSRAYQVTLRTLDAAQNGCSCPDFAANLLGTCKHVEVRSGWSAQGRARRGLAGAGALGGRGRRRGAAGGGPAGRADHGVGACRTAPALRRRRGAGGRRGAARPAAEALPVPGGGRGLPRLSRTRPPG